jgi:diguanylate cyclase (GGDEF)-like protein
MSAAHRMLTRIAFVLRYTQVSALALAAGIGFLIWTVAQRFTAEDEWIEHSHEVITKLDLVRSEALRASLEIRDFAIAPSPRAIAETRSAGEVALDATTEVQRLTIDNPEQQARAERVAAEVRKTVGGLTSAATIGEMSGTQALNRVLVARANRASTLELDRALEDMESHERELLVERFATQTAHMAWLKRLSFGGGLAFALFLVWSIAYSSKLMRLGRIELTELNVDACQDPLTGLMNRRALKAAVDRLPAQQDLAVMALDLDHFKPVNDRFGHAAGDHVLREVGARLRAQCRDQDLIARVGGDEFALVLPMIADVDQATFIAERVRSALRQPVVLESGESVRVDASIGTALREQGAATFEELLALADARSYDAKRAGRAHVELRLVVARPDGPIDESLAQPR